MQQLSAFFWFQLKHFLIRVALIPLDFQCDSSFFTVTYSIHDRSRDWTSLGSVLTKISHRVKRRIVHSTTGWYLKTLFFKTDLFVKMWPNIGWKCLVDMMLVSVKERRAVCWKADIRFRCCGVLTASRWTSPIQCHTSSIVTVSDGLAHQSTWVFNGTFTM